MSEFQQAIGYIALSVAALGRLGTIHGYIELRVIKRLLNARIGNTPEPPRIHAACGLRLRDLPRHRFPSIWTSIGAGRPKFRNLSDDVRG